jgi:hypothetical protein
MQTIHYTAQTLDVKYIHLFYIISVSVYIWNHVVELLLIRIVSEVNIIDNSRGSSESISTQWSPLNSSECPNSSQLLPPLAELSNSSQGLRLFTDYTDKGRSLRKRLQNCLRWRIKGRSLCGDWYYPPAVRSFLKWWNKTVLQQNEDFWKKVDG